MKKIPKKLRDQIDALEYRIEDLEDLGDELERLVRAFHTTLTVIRDKGHEGRIVKLEKHVRDLGRER